ncbi:hypothetical protein PR048_025225 [Dryococelus australis]|uniref:Integrase catalytic domain-containing protein n=1 Tax=Dryococelus australis TaxID=614101 RepID=A0ABQ9GQS2_9NEOP|nr:hypothetical protein PR048_025225 [Dryococelus australis]
MRSLPTYSPFMAGTLGAIFFQQDNSLSHIARIAQDCLSRALTVPWPARSPDKSPVDHASRVHHEQPFPASLACFGRWFSVTGWSGFAFGRSVPASNPHLFPSSWRTGFPVHVMSKDAIAETGARRMTHGVPSSYYVNDGRFCTMGVSTSSHLEPVQTIEMYACTTMKDGRSRATRAALQHHGFPLVDERPIMNAVEYRVVSGVVWSHRTMVSSNTDTYRTGVLAVVDVAWQFDIGKWVCRLVDSDVIRDCVSCTGQTEWGATTEACEEYLKFRRPMAEKPLGLTDHLANLPCRRLLVHRRYVVRKFLGSNPRWQWTAETVHVGAALPPPCPDCISELKETSCPQPPQGQSVFSEDCLDDGHTATTPLSPSLYTSSEGIFRISQEIPGERSPGPFLIPTPERVFFETIAASVRNGGFPQGQNASLMHPFIYLNCNGCLFEIWLGYTFENKIGKHVTNAMKIALREREPNLLQTDRGYEFFSMLFRKLMTDYGINHYAMDLKLGLLLPEIVEFYNSKYLRTIKMVSKEVKDNHLLKTIYNNVKVIDKRKQKFTWQIYTVYYIETYDGEPIKGRFYKHKLKKTFSNIPWCRDLKAIDQLQVWGVRGRSGQGGKVLLSQNQTGIGEEHWSRGLVRRINEESTKDKTITRAVLVHIKSQGPSTIGSGRNCRGPSATFDKYESTAYEHPFSRAEDYQARPSRDEELVLFAALMFAVADFPPAGNFSREVHLFSFVVHR